MGVTVVLPNSFTNGSTADAGQMMADLNALVAGLAKAIDGADGDTVAGLVNFTGGLHAGGYNVLEALSGGYKAQSGNLGSTAGAGTGVATSVTFSTAFLTVPDVWITPVTGSSNSLPALNNGGYASYGVYNATTTGFTLVTNQASSTAYYWVAIGS